MLFESKLPHKYWFEAFLTANYLVNLLPSSDLDVADKSPYQKQHGKATDYLALRTFGCAYFPTLRDYAANKFDPRSLRCVFLGYNAWYKGYRCLYPPTGRVYISRHVVFDEGSYPFAEKYKHLQHQLSTPLMSAWQQSFPAANPSENNDNNQSSTTPKPPVTIEQVIPLFTERDCHPLQTSVGASSSSAPDPFSISAPVPPVPVQPPAVSGEAPSTSCHPMTTRSKAGIRKPNPRYVLMTSKVAYPEPKTVTKALKDKRWHDPMAEEINNCHETGTWVLVPYKEEMHVLGCRWVFRTQLNADGTLKKRRSRLVAKGYEQSEGIDYLDTYSPMVRIATIRLVLHTATVMQWEIVSLMFSMLSSMAI